MLDRAFKKAAQTSPTGSLDADSRWLTYNGKILAPPLYRKEYEFVFNTPMMARMRRFDTVPVFAKNSGKTIYKRVRRAYPTAWPVSSPDVMRSAKRVCTTPRCLRSNEEPLWVKNVVENAGFWDHLSAKVHTRNALYVDEVLPWTENVVPRRQKHRRDVDNPTSPAADVAMILNLEKMAVASKTFLEVEDLTNPVVDAVIQDLRRGRFPLTNSLPTIDEVPEPVSPGLIRTTARSSTRRRQSRWSPTRHSSSFITRSIKPARVSPSPERSPAKWVADAAVPSTPTSVVFSKTEVQVSSAKETSPASAEAPLRIFSANEPEPITAANSEAQNQESSHIQRSRRRSKTRRSLASEARISAIDGKEATVNQISVLEGSGIDPATVDVDPKSPSAETTPNAGSEHPVATITVDAERENPVVEETIVKDSTIGGTEKLIISTNSDDSGAERSIFYTDLEEPVVEKTLIMSRLEDSVLEQTRAQTLRTVNVYFGPESERRLSDASCAPSTPEYSINARENLDIFNRPVAAIKSLAGVASGVKTAISDSKVAVEKIDGKLVVRFKLPSTYADLFNSRYPPITAAGHDDLDSPRDETDVADITHLSTDTDELVAGLPATPTHIVLGGSPVTRQEGPVFSSSPVFPPSTPTAEKVEELASPSVPVSPAIAATRVGDQVASSGPVPPALAATRVEDQVTASSPTPSASMVEDGATLAVLVSPTLAATRVSDQVAPSGPGSPAVATIRVGGQTPSSPLESETAPAATFSSLLESPFAPSCAGTPKRPTSASPSRALEHNVPSEPREMPSGASASQSNNPAQDQEAADRAYLDRFLNEHRAGKAARCMTQGSQAPSNGSPTPRTPLRKLDANAASPMKAGKKRRADDEEEEDVAKPLTKRGRKGLRSEPKTGDEAPLRRSSRVRARAQQAPAGTGSKIPVLVGSNVLEGPAAGGETMEADLASVTRANTRRNKGKALPPAEVLARRQDPASRMRELKEVHDARASRGSKGARKGVQWGENSEIVYDPGEGDEVEEAEEAPKRSGGGRKGAPRKGVRQKKGTEPKGKVAKEQPATPVARRTRASSRRAREATGAL